MFIHEKDNTEVQVKIFDDGSLVVYCPKCKTLWANHFNVVPKTKTTEIILDSKDHNLKFNLAGVYTNSEPHDFLKNYFETKDVNSAQIFTHAKEAFPVAFVKNSQ